MPYYPRLKANSLKPELKKRIATNIIKLKKQINTELPNKDLDKSLLLATWNIRDFGKNGAKHGARTIEDLFYIAELISSFDLVAVQEINDLKDWETIMDILGRDWDYIATDVSEFAEGGNGERMTFVYDKRKVWFKNIAGEVVLSRAKLISENVVMEDNTNVSVGRQFARTPFLVAFQSSWFNFDICTVHIYFGAESGEKLIRRIKEIDTIAAELKDRAELSLEENKHAMLLLGDFNIVHPEHETMKALKKHKFKLPKKIEKPSNIGEDKYYDQIAIRAKDDKLLNHIDKADQNNAGVFDLYKEVMRPSDWAVYKEEMQKTTDGKKLTSDNEFKNYFKEWKTYHLSDHKPMWVKIPIDLSDEYLNALIVG
jgi:endonuclease/exonuclease/phosphatase family metal-dependent hydrolase